MFTGIIQAVGTVRAIEQRAGDVRLGINTGKLDLSDVTLGDSIAVSGACLTAVTITGRRFEVDVSPETLARTTFGRVKPGASAARRRLMNSNA